MRATFCLHLDVAREAGAYAYLSLLELEAE